MNKYHPWNEEFNSNILLFLQSGIIDRDVLFIFKYQIRNENIPPLVLSMDHLGIGFEIIDVMLGISSAMFILEIALERVLKLFYFYLMAEFRRLKKAAIDTL